MRLVGIVGQRDGARHGYSAGEERPCRRDRVDAVQAGWCKVGLND